MTKLRDKAENSDLMKALLNSVIAFIAKTGMPLMEIEDVMAKSLAETFPKEGRVRKNPTTKMEYGCDTAAGAVLRAWHRIPKYLDSYARPRPLKLRGTGLSLAALVRSQSRAVDADAIVESMKRAGLLKQVGRGEFLPARESATIQTLTPLAIDHVAKTIMRLVETASNNTQKSRDRLTLIERYAHVPDLASSEARAFASFTKQQGQACLDTIEDWLETRQVAKYERVGKAAKKSTNAGVHIFAFIGGEARNRSVPTRRKVNPRVTAREARV